MTLLVKKPASLLIILFTLLALLTSCAKEPAKNSATPTQATTIEFRVKDADGNDVYISEKRGKLLFVNFWATWCPPCKEELPDLNAYYLARKGDKFDMVAINVGEQPEQSINYFEKNELEIPLLMDPNSTSSAKLGVTGLPVSLLIDEEGYLLEAWMGPINLEGLEKIIDPYLGISPESADQ